MDNKKHGWTLHWLVSGLVDHGISCSRSEVLCVRICSCLLCQQAGQTSSFLTWELYLDTGEALIWTYWEVTVSPSPDAGPGSMASGTWYITHTAFPSMGQVTVSSSRSVVLSSLCDLAVEAHKGHCSALSVLSLPPSFPSSAPPVIPAMAVQLKCSSWSIVSGSDSGDPGFSVSASWVLFKNPFPLGLGRQFSS